MKRRDLLVEKGLPASPEAEKAVLGAILLDNGAFAVAASVITEDCFSIDAHRKIFTRMAALRSSEPPAPIDSITLAEALLLAKELEVVGGLSYISDLTAGLPRAVNVAFYAQIVKEKRDQRKVIYAARDIYEAAMDGDRQTALANVEAARATLASGTRTSLRAVGAAEFLGMTIPVREMLLGPIIPEQSLSMLFGRRGLGKTHIALGIAVAVASGRPFLRWRADRPRRVLFVDGEMPASLLQKWLAETVLSLGLTGDLDGLRIITPDLQDRGIADLSTAEGQAVIDPYTCDADLVILDNLSALCRAGKENEAESWQPMQDWALAMRRAGKSVLFLHHAGRTGEDARGTSKREDLLDTVIKLRQPGDYRPAEGLRCEVHVTKGRDLFGEAARPFLASLASNWTIADLEERQSDRAARLFRDGADVKAVMEETGISRATAFRLKRESQSREYRP